MITEMRRRAQARSEERARRRVAEQADVARAAATAAVDRARRRVAIVGLVEAATASTTDTPIARRSGTEDGGARRAPATGAFVLAG